MQLFVADIFETMQGAPVTEFVEQINTCCATAARHGATDEFVAVLREMYISGVAMATICNK